MTSYISVLNVSIDYRSLGHDVCDDSMYNINKSQVYLQWSLRKAVPNILRKRNWGRNNQKNFPISQSSTLQQVLKTSPERDLKIHIQSLTALYPQRGKSFYNTLSCAQADSLVLSCVISFGHIPFCPILLIYCCILSSSDLTLKVYMFKCFFENSFPYKDRPYET